MVINRRRFVQQSLGFSALAAVGTMPKVARALISDPGSAELLMVGDWGADEPTAQSGVAAGMRQYVQHHALRPQALLMLGDNWYGALEGGVRSSRWQTQFEDVPSRPICLSCLCHRRQP